MILNLVALLGHLLPFSPICRCKGSDFDQLITKQHLNYLTVYQLFDHYSNISDFTPYFFTFNSNSHNGISLEEKHTTL